ncbi:helix-turn-helix domain-containing protein [Sphingomonas sp. SM33]|uniref:Helix-turn-helix domain-containing protein n=1 Tax=Sphingomonas telluris TaxID=2907998 RepID=A0ABS9VQB4_9SPHN|nr:helix-turn-helix domain-containing protein [Sphingomonas telluris]MCH8617166.1 helix-turn-helix domain-containing protein [Sphingomonas telluris]
MGRAALGWSQRQLAEAAKTRQETVSGFEAGNDSRRSTVAKMRGALEAAGVVFLSSGEASLAGGEGVRLKGSA